MTNPNEIGYFRVTNREFENAMEALNLDQEEIISLPTNAVIAEIGSGLDQNFANGIKDIRPDIKVLSLDPTLGLPKSDFFTTHENTKDDKLGQVSYSYYGEDSYYGGKIPDYADPQNVAEEIRTIRYDQAKSTGNVVSGLAPEIPFATDSLDMLIDTWGPGLYLDRYKENSQLEIYLQNVVRVLKQNGQARIYPIDFYNEAMEDKSFSNSNAKEEYSKILGTLSGVSIEFYEKDDLALKRDNDNTRIGIKIRKL